MTRRLGYLVSVLSISGFVATVNASTRLNLSDASGDRAVLAEYCGGFMISDWETNPICRCIADQVDTDKFPQIIEHVDLTLDGSYALTPAEQKNLRSLHSKCEADPNVVKEVQDAQAASDRATVVAFCRQLEADGINLDCDCFLNEIAKNLDHKFANQLATKNLEKLKKDIFLGDDQIQALKRGVRECRR